jgi:hypothetical protein
MGTPHCLHPVLPSRYASSGFLPTVLMCSGVAGQRGSHCGRTAAPGARGAADTGQVRVFLAFPHAAAGVCKA